jgi:hypothetical protein
MAIEPVADYDAPTLDTLQEAARSNAVITHLQHVEIASARLWREGLWDSGEPKAGGLKNRAGWAKWITRYRSELQAVGLPPEVYLSLEHWEDFLENGYLALHPQDRT